GGAAGGVGSAVSGGNFWHGVRNGLISSTLNHVAHSVLQQQDPLKKHRNKVEHTLDEWIVRYKDKSWTEIAFENGSIDGLPAGPKPNWRYVINPVDGNVMDMRHVVVV